MQRIMMIGNSHSIDAFQLLFEVFKAHSPEQEVVLGIMYYSGCPISKHVRFGCNDEPVYQYWLNEDGSWKVTKQATLRASLKDQPWDLIFLQAAKSDLDDTLNLSDRRLLEQLVEECVPTPHKFAWHTSWPSPNDETFFSPEHVPQPPAGYKERLIRLYGFNPITQFTVLTDKAKNHILPDSTYSQSICTGAAIMHATQVLGVSQRMVYRDYTHLSDYGRLMAAYAFYAQFTGKPLTDILVDTVPAALRSRRFQVLGDLQITEEMKQQLIAAANHALADPWTVPAPHD